MLNVGSRRIRDNTKSGMRRWEAPRFTPNSCRFKTTVQTPLPLHSSGRPGSPGGCCPSLPPKAQNVVARFTTLNHPRSGLTPTQREWMRSLGGPSGDPPPHSLPLRRRSDPSVKVPTIPTALADSSIFLRLWGSKTSRNASGGSSTSPIESPISLFTHTHCTNLTHAQMACSNSHSLITLPSLCIHYLISSGTRISTVEAFGL